MVASADLYSSQHVEGLISAVTSLYHEDKKEENIRLFSFSIPLSDLLIVLFIVVFVVTPRYS